MLADYRPVGNKYMLSYNNIQGYLDLFQVPDKKIAIALSNCFNSAKLFTLIINASALFGFPLNILSICLID